jgi:FlaA1/EpsC-like NDP-sugar epimerase
LRWMTQAGIFVLSGVGAFLLRFDLRVPEDELSHLAYGIAIWIALKSVAFRMAGLHRGGWRYVSLADLYRIALANVGGSVLSCILISALAPTGFPRSIYLIDLILCLLATSGLRAAVRLVMEAKAKGPQNGTAKRTLIYGAGVAGLTLLREIRANPKLPYRVCGFLDDDPVKAGAQIQGVPVVGGGADLEELVRTSNAEVILTAIPSATGEQMTSILDRCQRCRAAGVNCKMVPGLAEVIEGNGAASYVREVAVEDLLGRRPVRLDERQIRERLGGSVALVTGAAGSIGSELCRQIARFGPSVIVGFEIAETPLFHLEREMRQLFPGLKFYPEIGSVQNPQRLAEVFQRYKPSIVYHAAAYKHVPMMEAHGFEAIENNVFGTYNVAVAAAEFGTEDFVMISTDKAVRPTSVMGATKRFSEQVVQSLQNGKTRYVAVRFGNVLGSNGSVIPLFKQQIAEGGPVTVTHPEMQRYFMTIPEAAQLVLQAASMGRGGEIFVLDMGQPVKIVDLARNLILLSGLRPDVDIRIEFTGMRPGEKLYEELSAFEESTAPTSHEKIKTFIGPTVPKAEVMGHLRALWQICQRRDRRELVLRFKASVPEYNPSVSLLEEALEVRGAGERGPGAGQTLIVTDRWSAADRGPRLEVQNI